MTVRELKEFLETCNQDIQVIIAENTGSFNVIHSISSVEQVKPISLHDEPEYPEVVEIAVN